MKLKDGFELRTICGEKVVIAQGIENINFDKMINLNPSAAYLWEAVQGRQFSADDLARLLCEEYDVAQATALHDATQLLRTWQELGLVEE